jgi:signal transduction histidine kinase
LGRLVALLLDVTMLDLGRFVVDRELVDVAPLVERVVHAAQTRTNRHALNLRQPASLMATVDVVGLQQVVSNLVDNAIRYSPDGGPIDIEAVQTDNQTLCLSVRDRGLGIPTELRPRLFQRYFRGHDHRYASGLGLGLFVSRAIVSRHGGTITAEFPSDGGTRFVVELPLGGRGPVADLK